MSFPKFLWTSKRWQIVLTTTLIVFAAPLLRSGSQATSFTGLWQWMDPFLTISTVILAVFIWFNETKQDWENTLPKKLNVYFRLQGNADELIYEARNAPLTGAGDIRQWGQQLGRQMNQADLAFHGFNVTGPQRDKDSSGSYVMRYQLTIWLQTHDEAKPRKVWVYDDEGKLVLDEASAQRAPAQ